MKTVAVHLPFDSDQIDADVNGEKPFVLCQAHFQELFPVQLFNWLIF